jgi:hypothetical protein
MVDHRITRRLSSGGTVMARMSLLGRRVGGLVALAAMASGCAASHPGEKRPAATNPTIRACERVAGQAPWRGITTVKGRMAPFDADDDFFSPTCLVVPWNTPVTLVVTNTGHLPHTVTLPGTAVNMDIDAGQTVFVRIPGMTKPKRMVCTFHTSEHMFAAIVPERSQSA